MYTIIKTTQLSIAKSAFKQKNSAHKPKKIKKSVKNLRIFKTEKIKWFKS